MKSRGSKKSGKIFMLSVHEFLPAMSLEPFGI
jgi:hypothetical protein